jgi:hypothetical protein
MVIFCCNYCVFVIHVVVFIGIHSRHYWLSRLHYALVCAQCGEYETAMTFAYQLAIQIDYVQPPLIQAHLHSLHDLTQRFVETCD